MAAELRLKVHRALLGSGSKGNALVVEYANTQNDANHAHAVWRVFNGDFGRDILKEHVEKEHQAKSGAQ